MPDLNFQVETAQVVRYAAAPTIVFKLKITNAIEPEQIHSIALHAQIQIDATRRRYTSGDQERLHDLFGEPARWSQTLRTMLWTLTSANVPPFSGSATVDLLVPCTYDFNLAATKYFYALEDGEVPLTVLFSGTIFYETDEAGLQIAQIPWEKEAVFRLPVQVWKEMMDQYYPNSAWLCLNRDIFDRLYLYKVQKGLPTWEQTLESLLPVEEKGRPG